MKVGDRVKIIGVNNVGANHYINHMGEVTGIQGNYIIVEKIKMKTGEKWSWFPESSLEKIKPEKLPKPSPEKPPEFKVGDEVEIIGESYTNKSVHIGDKATISSDYNDGDYGVLFQSGVPGVYSASSLKLITKEPKTEPMREPKFKKGDRVRTNLCEILTIDKVIPKNADNFKHNHYHYKVGGRPTPYDELQLTLIEENRVDYPEGTFYCCYVDGTGGFSVKHDTEAEAMKEAERLAKQGQNHGRKVHVLKVIASCEVPDQPVQWNFK